MVEMSVVTHIEPEVLTFSTHATLTTSVGTTPRRPQSRERSAHTGPGFRGGSWKARGGWHTGTEDANGGSQRVAQMASLGDISKCFPALFDLSNEDMIRDQSGNVFPPGVAPQCFPRGGLVADGIFLPPSQHHRHR